MSTSVLPGSTTAPSPSTRADTVARSESSMSVAASRSSPSRASSRIPDRIWIAVRLDTARPTTRQALDELFLRARDPQPRADCDVTLNHLMVLIEVIGSVDDGEDVPGAGR